MLIDEAHFTVFLTWYQLGGMKAPPTLTEVLAWPAALRHDVLYLVREMGAAHAAARRRGDKGRGRK